MSVSGIGSSVPSVAPTATTNNGGEATANNAGSSTDKISPEGEIASILAKSFFDNQNLFKQVFDPVKEAIDEGSN